MLQLNCVPFLTCMTLVTLHLHLHNQRVEYTCTQRAIEVYTPYQKVLKVQQAPQSVVYCTRFHGDAWLQLVRIYISINIAQATARTRVSDHNYVLSQFTTSAECTKSVEKSNVVLTTNNSIYKYAAKTSSEIESKMSHWSTMTSRSCNCSGSIEPALRPSGS